MLPYLRDEPTDNGYARPIEGVIAFVDMATAEVLEVSDHGVVPVPTDAGSYFPADNAPLRDRPAAARHRPARRPELHRRGPRHRAGSAGRCACRWTRTKAWCCTPSATRTAAASGRSCTAPRSARWSCRTATRAAARLEERVRRRRVGPRPHGELARARLRLPRRDPLPRRGVRRRARRARTRSPTRSASTRRTTASSGSTRTCTAARPRCAGRAGSSVSSIATVGNYEYGFYWYFYLDGSIQLEVKLTGIMSTMAFDPARRRAVARATSSRRVWPRRTTSTCSASGSTWTSTAPTTRCTRSTSCADAAGADNPMGNAFRPHATRLDTRARRAADRRSRRAAARGRSSTRTSRNALGQPVAYKLVPGPTPTLLADPASSVGRRAAFATRNLWVTPYEPSERRAAGPHPNQSSGGDGLPRWTAADRSLVDTDVVLWYTFGVTHVAAARGLAGDAGRVRGLPARARSASSTATRRSTSRRRRTTATAEEG